MARYTEAPDLKKLSKQIVEKYPSQYPYVATDRIIFVWDEKPKEQKKYAYVRKIDDLSKSRDPDHDFYLVVARYMVKDFSESQLKALLCHELNHIGERDLDKDGNEKVKLINHDFEEFYSIVGAFGQDWPYNPNCPDPLKTTVTFTYRPAMPSSKDKKKREKNTNLQIAAKNK